MMHCYWSWFSMIGRLDAATVAMPREFHRFSDSSMRANRSSIRANRSSVSDSMKYAATDAPA